MTNFKTARDFYNAIINGTTITSEMIDYANSAIEKMDEKNKNRRNTMTKTQAENAETKEKILAYMRENGKQSAKSLADVFEISTQKISALMKQLVDDNKITVARDKFEGSSSKVNVYSLVE